MPRAGLTPDVLVDIALDILDETGEVSLAKIAARANVATPSLYKHIANLAQLRELIAIRATDQLNEQITEASLGRSGPEAIRAAMTAWRRYVLEYPHRYAAIPLEPLSDPALAEAGDRLMRTAGSVFRRFELTSDELVHAIRALRVIVHGFSTLEAGGGFGLPQDLDRSFAKLIDMYLASLPSH
ncbi:TetR family transcriptional regulator [Stackebrandtia endophytica]|uniref:TetR family transcriptional regulator n=1 Tax=Stackebrandtia endophytica TaxID=1496996 RepID=A0A543AXZ2_9ACTN|nr:TetR-like C-terminal domain-containing protein [Stackebrandtia endophytica]TQL77449.1 TetR family transcriptional regulator [Stackebrandtia endophytica]